VLALETLAVATSGKAGFEFDEFDEKFGLIHCHYQIFQPRSQQGEQRMTFEGAIG
jgi:hypothetical protein